MKFRHIHLLTALLLAPDKNYVALVGAACPPDGEDAADWVDCVAGVVRDTAQTCESACNGKCCVGGTGNTTCNGARACIKKDGSCNGLNACYLLAVNSAGQPIVSGPSCVGASACDGLGGDDDPPDYITGSCNGYQACYHFATVGTFGNLLASCNGITACKEVCYNSDCVPAGSLNGACNADSVCAQGTIIFAFVCTDRDTSTPSDCFLEPLASTPLSSDGICDGSGQCINVPSAAPSEVPSDAPSLSSKPSDVPSSDPSTSNAPSNKPSSEPSSEPSSDPTTSSAPSSAPSLTKGKQSKGKSLKSQKSQKATKSGKWASF